MLIVVMSLPITNGLVGWYKGEAWNGTSWPDLSGNGNHCTELVPNCTIKKADTYIYGGTGDGIRFPSAILPSTYTLFHVARYNGPTKGRIFDGVSTSYVNWLSGFHGSRTGVAYHGDSYGGWLTQYGTTAFPLDQILISTDQKRIYRGNGVNLTINSVTGSADRLSINYGHFTGERSDWAVWEVIVYNRELSLAEIETVENYLFNAQYTYTNPIVPRGVNYFNPRDIVFYKKQGQTVFVNQMTANTTNILGLGNVVASASSVYNSGSEAWYAFNGVTLSDYWHSAAYTYSNGTYTGSASLGGYSGEWLKIEFPIPLFLNYSVLYARYIPDNWTKRLVKNGYLLASNDDTNWSVIQYINRTPEAYTETSFVLVDKYIQRPFKYYAVVATKLFALGGVDSIQISEWYMNVKIPKFQISEPFYPYDYVFYNGLQAYLDATSSESYPGSGTTWYDISGNGRDGTWSAEPNYDSTGWFNTSGFTCTGPASNSFGITDTTGYTIFITWYQYNLTSPVTFQFYRNGTGNAARGIYAHCTWSNGNIYFDQGGCCGADTRTYVACPNPTGTWHTTALVRETNSSTRHIYIDGVLRITNTATAVDINLDGTAVNYVGPGGVWDARLKCFIAYNRGLSANEILSLHNRFRV